MGGTDLNEERVTRRERSLKRIETEGKKREYLHDDDDDGGDDDDMVGKSRSAAAILGGRKNAVVDSCL